MWGEIKTAAQMRSTISHLWPAQHEGNRTQAWLLVQIHALYFCFIFQERGRWLQREKEKTSWLWWLYPVSVLSAVLKQQRLYLWKQSRPKGQRDKPALCSTLNEAYSWLSGSAGGEKQSSETLPLDPNTLHSDPFTTLGHRADEETTLTLWHLIQTHQITGPRLRTFKTILH